MHLESISLIWTEFSVEMKYNVKITECKQVKWYNKFDKKGSAMLNFGFKYG